MKIYKDQGAYHAKVPTLTKGEPYLHQSFKNRPDAYQWQNIEGVKLWGWRRWLLILEGGTRKLRSMTSSVTVRPVTDTYTLSTGELIEYFSYQVRWRESGRERTKHFNPNKYDSSKEAEHEANLYAAHKRAEITGGELHLPPFIQFDLSEV